MSWLFYCAGWNDLQWAPTAKPHSFKSYMYALASPRGSWDRGPQLLPSPCRCENYVQSCHKGLLEINSTEYQAAGWKWHQVLPPLQHAVKHSFDPHNMAGISRISSVIISSCFISLTIQCSKSGPQGKLYSMPWRKLQRVDIGMLFSARGQLCEVS